MFCFMHAWFFLVRSRPLVCSLFGSGRIVRRTKMCTLHQGIDTKCHYENKKSPVLPTGLLQRMSIKT